MPPDAHNLGPTLPTKPKVMRGAVPLFSLTICPPSATNFGVAPQWLQGRMTATSKGPGLWRFFPLRSLAHGTPSQISKRTSSRIVVKRPLPGQTAPTISL
ncbi:uncharacterized protein CIMG_13282 [Coccidioides immitis RS]|uniref:Uncharacterized protein n=4 Tax=Coccidioides immitis TaxID=5501 RepID=A0A0D8JU34_COCIM|nr:uncharacterized protein CIMG_13282 [Coccidioides immitis RS]KJF60860.1 hypothetical protein CIMG_13282 [Coccidioides immitis RS]KMP06340.1 hypothetical protein CIRG_06022 [Coccidioides immitis RMSCC 2394]KMU80456.1 hypothetical protein CISG_02306 [Coccidioides immitis RMSCC 3703]KMU83908.1 hypothetical protein CIHG_01693 [Coccidioides immitis H538.4]